MVFCFGAEVLGEEAMTDIRMSRKGGASRGERMMRKNKRERSPEECEEQL